MSMKVTEFVGGAGGGENFAQRKLQAQLSTGMNAIKYLSKKQYQFYTNSSEN